jgi:hypothetical protein
MVQRIPLSGVKGAGLFALVDDEDFELVSRYTWHLYVSKSGGRYAKTGVREPGDARRRIVPMHQLITGKRYLDHANGDGLDNTRGNFREADFSQNGANGGKRATRGVPTSRFKGVYWASKRRRWIVAIRFQGKVIHCGSFTDEVTAARAYDETAVRLWGAFARTNEMLGLLLCLPIPMPNTRCSPIPTTRAGSGWSTPGYPSRAAG